MINLNTVFFHSESFSSLCLTEHDFSEIFRYAGIKNKSSLTNDEIQQFTQLINSSINQISSVINARSVYIKVDINIENSTEIIFLDKIIQSKDLSKNLKDCNQVYLFAATLGAQVDKLIIKQSKINPPLTIFLQATGAMFIEKYCNILQKYLAEQENQNILVPRFSPGYGDVKLETQQIFFDLLQCQKNLALTLNNSFFMTPEKSVTAFIGVKSKY